jgi:hypothetical protein
VTEESWEQRMANRAAERADRIRRAEHQAWLVETSYARAAAVFRHILELRILQVRGAGYCRDCWTIAHVGPPWASAHGRYEQLAWVHYGEQFLVDEVRHELDEWRDQPVPVCRHACHGPVGYVLPAPVAWA